MKGLRATTTVVAAIVLSAAFAAPRSAGAHGAERSASPMLLPPSCTSSVGPGIPPPTRVPSGPPSMRQLIEPERGQFPEEPKNRAAIGRRI